MDATLEKAQTPTKGAVDLEFSFDTNNTSSPVTSGTGSTLRGVGLDFIDSIAYSTVGIILVTLTLKARARYQISKLVELEDLNAADDGAYATAGPIQNQGSSSAKQTFKIYTRAANGTKTDFTNRKVNVRIRLKNTTVGI
jgi:hypothetical protein